MVITKLRETSSDQVKKLLESCSVSIKKEIAGRFDIICPACQKPEAFIEYKHEKRWIKCNRENNCGYNKSLWELIAEKQGISSIDNAKMLEYINYTIGQDFVRQEKREPIIHSIQESVRENQEFLNHCNQIFKNSFKQASPEIKVSWEYLNSRGYSDKNIKAFNLGYLPNLNKFSELLIASPYNYSESEAKKLIQKYFGHILSWNNKNIDKESMCNRIAFTWYDKNNNVAGFSFRHPSGQELDMKYPYNKGSLKSQMLFNINNYQASSKKQIVIVEGTFDALAASHLSSKNVQDNYFFIAMGSNRLTEGQVQLLKAHSISEVILLIDNDEAGNKYQSNIQRLAEYNITASVGRIPTQYKDIKDIDELLRKHPEDNNILMEILNNTEEVETKIEPIQKGQPADIHSLKRQVDESKESKLLDVINQEISTQQFSKEFMEKAKQYNDLLFVNYEEDNAYTNGQFLQDLQDTPSGLKTGFAGLDQHIVIQPSTLNFVAGRPSHGKTTVMLNMLRNMIRNNPNKAFMFYSYEETHVDIMSKIILSCTENKDSEIEKLEDSESSYFAQAKNHLKKYAATAVEDRGKLITCASHLHKAYKEVECWLDEGRLHIMTRKPNVESLSGSIIERVRKIEDKSESDNGKAYIKGKKVAAIFVDYVQKLNTEEDKINRQQELHKVCKDLLNTACDKRVDAAIIMGAQANREVKSLETFLLENMREAGDIEQDANVVIGVWDEEAGTIARLQQKLAEAKDKQEDINLGKPRNNNGKSYTTFISNIESKLKPNELQSKELTLKVLKNRNGKNNFCCKAESFSERFSMQDKKAKDKNIEMSREDVHKALSL